jgi:hypothetical protein
MGPGDSSLDPTDSFIPHPGFDTFKPTVQENLYSTLPDRGDGGCLPSNAALPSRISGDAASLRDSNMEPEDCSAGPKNGVIPYPGFEPYSSSPGEAPGIGRPSRDPESNFVLIQQPAFPWHRPQDEPRVNISGGTFIGGNLNYVDKHTFDPTSVILLFLLYLFSSTCHAI